MVKIKEIVGIGVFVLLSQVGYSQIKINSNFGTGNINSNTSFLDGSSSPSFNSSTNEGKGLLFPRVDLTSLAAMTMAGSPSATNNPNSFDGMLVYNTGVGTSAIGSISVTAGFYYYENSTADIDGGTWQPMSAGDANTIRTITTDDTAAANDYILLCDTSGSGFTLRLPLASVVQVGKVYIIRKTDVSANVLTINPGINLGSLTVSALNFPITIQVVSDGTNWNVLN
jgi:hypothetical protein